MKKIVNYAEAWRLAQAAELIRWVHGKPVKWDARGKIIPSAEALSQIHREYCVVVEDLVWTRGGPKSKIVAREDFTAPKPKTRAAK